MEESREMSSFDAPITNKVPCCVTTLAVVMELIRSKKLKLVTEIVRKDKTKKNRILMYITPAGVFSYCKDSGIITWSGYMNFDFDDLLKKYGITPETFKKILAADPFLNFNLLNISVSGKGLKGILTVKDGILEEYELYYSIIEKYFLDTYGIKADSSCRNLSRAYYLSHDADVYYNKAGFVEREALLNLLPPPNDATDCRDAIDRVSTNNDNKTSTSVPVFTKPSYSTGERPSDKLNKLPEIHALAVQAIESIGWRQKTEETWTRAGKDLKEGCSAIWNIWDQEGIWIFTCYTTNGLPFKANKGYTDTQILCIINYSDSWMDCISDLAAMYLID